MLTLMLAVLAVGCGVGSENDDMDDKLATLGQRLVRRSRSWTGRATTRSPRPAPYGGGYQFGTARNTVLMVSTGCHLPADAHPGAR